MTDGWQVVVPFRGRGGSKSRLALPAATPSDLRPRLARAFLLDVVDACLATPQVRGVLVVTSDRDVTDRLAGSTVAVLPDPGEGLNPAASAGLEACRAAAAGPVAVLTGDLPTLTPADLSEALVFPAADGAAADSATGWLVPDRSGTGTTTLLFPVGTPGRFAFGPDSAARHRALGYRELSLPRTSTLRFDVDTLDDLVEAIGVGVGRHTAPLTGLLGPVPRWARDRLTG